MPQTPAPDPEDAARAHIGNVIRLAALMHPEEVETVCEMQGDVEEEEMLLSPTEVAVDEVDTDVNTQLLDAFRQFHQVVLSAKQVTADADGPPE